MKIFVVTTGGNDSHYGTYAIDRIFLDESKASQYSDVTWDSRVEIFDASDDEIEGIKGYHVIVARYGPHNKGTYKGSVYSTFKNTLSDQVEPDKIECNLVTLTDVMEVGVTGYYHPQLPEVVIRHTIPYTQMIEDRERRFQTMAVEIFGKLDQAMRIDGLTFEEAKLMIEKGKVVNE